MNNHPDYDPTYAYDRWLATLPKEVRWAMEDEQQQGDPQDDDEPTEEEANA
jgi:hypothetical protein